MRTFALVSLAGAACTGLRHLANTLFAAETSPTLPFRTLAINIIGSLLMGFLMPFALKRSWSPEAIAIIATGFLGGFTTYSMFNYDVTVYFTTGEWMKAFAYVALTVLGGLGAGFLGLAIAAHQ